MKYDIFIYGDEETLQKHPDKYSQFKIVDPYLSSMSWTCCSQKKPSRGKNINIHTHTDTHTHTQAITIIPNILKIIAEANQVYNNTKTAEYADDLTTAGVIMSLKNWLLSGSKQIVVNC